MKVNLLCKNDKIAIYCGSRQLHEKDMVNYDNSCNFIKEKGFELVADDYLYSKTANYFYPAEQRAEFFNKVIKDKTIKALFSCKGGADCIAMLDYLDYKEIKKNPKIICGYSDITVLINYINYKCKIKTFWGPNFTLLGKKEAQFCREDFISKFINNNKSLGRETDEYKVIRKGVAFGEFVGGTISAISFLAVGKYKIDFTNKILILEEFGKKIEPLKVKSYLAFLKQNGAFDKVSGIWMGNYDNDFDYNLEDDILQLTKDKNFPIIKSNNFGHIFENMIIPIGEKAYINTSNKIPITICEG